MQITKKQKLKGFSQPISQKKQYQTSQTERFVLSSTKYNVSQVVDQSRQDSEKRKELTKTRGQLIKQQTQFINFNDVTVGGHFYVDQSNASIIDENRKKSILLKPISLVNIKHDDIANEHFQIGTQNKFINNELSQLQNNNVTLADFGMKAKHMRQFPIDSLKGLKKDYSFSQSQIQTRTIQFQSQSQTKISENNIAQQIINDLKSKMLNKIKTISKQFSPSKKQKIKLNNQKDESNNHNNSFQIDELPFKKKSLLPSLTNTIQPEQSPFSSSVVVSNQSPLLNVQQHSQQNKLLNQSLPDSIQNIKQLDQSNLTQYLLKDNSLVSAQNKQINLDNQLQSTKTSFALPLVPNQDNSSNVFQRNQSQNLFQRNNQFKNTFTPQIDTSKSFVQRDIPIETAYRFSLKKTNSQNIAAQFSLQQSQKNQKQDELNNKQEFNIQQQQNNQNQQYVFSQQQQQLLEFKKKLQQSDNIKEQTINIKDQLNNIKEITEQTQKFQKQIQEQIICKEQNYNQNLFYKENQNIKSGINQHQQNTKQQINKVLLSQNQIKNQQKQSLKQQDEIMICENDKEQNCSSHQLFNEEINQNEEQIKNRKVKHGVIFQKFQIFQKKCVGKGNDIQSEEGIQDQSGFTSQFALGLQRKQLKCNQVSFKGTKHSSKENMQLQFDQQNDEEEENFIELCQEFSIL